MNTVAVHISPVARHEVYRVHGEFKIITTRPDWEPTDLERHKWGRAIPVAEAMEWIEMCRAGGGVVHEREVGHV